MKQLVVSNLKLHFQWSISMGCLSWPGGRGAFTSGISLPVGHEKGPGHDQESSTEGKNSIIMGKKLSCRFSGVEGLNVFTSVPSEVEGTFL